MQGLEYDFVREAQVREEEESTSEEVFRRRREKRLRVLHLMRGRVVTQKSY